MQAILNYKRNVRPNANKVVMIEKLAAEFLEGIFFGVSFSSARIDV